MVDETPLLLSSPAPEGTAGEKEPILGAAAASLDETIERCIGGFGRAQMLQAVLVSFAWVFDAQQTFISVFTDRQPSWHCAEENPVCSAATVATGTTRCGLPPSSWAWDEPAAASMVSEWDLTCRSSSSLLASLPASSFYAGCLLGGFLLATLADSRLGRKNMLLLSCSLMSLTGLLTAFSHNIWVYSFLRLLSGFGRATIGTCALVLSTELVGKRWRGQVGVLGFFGFTLGFLSLPCLAFFLHRHQFSWRALYVSTSAPVLLYCLLVYFLVHESPRWLFVSGRAEEAVKTLAKIGAANGRESNLSDFSGLINFCPEEETARDASVFSAMKVLWEKRWTFRRLLVIMVVSFGVGLVYYAMPLAVETLDFNLYLSVTFNALSELPAALLTFFLIGSLSRRRMVLVFTLLSCAASVACGAMAKTGEAKTGDAGNIVKWVQIGLEVVSFFSACSAFNVVLIYTLELFPTCVRNSALSMARQSLVLGGVFGPMLVAVGRKEGGSVVSFGIFGLTIGLCGLFVVALPETRGAAFCDTMEEQEREESTPEATKV
ncbi:hypothetical protein H6P81_019189 [Aristolochia fimbriata]|uniref:Major facilitator superfamily (MFS) profile domain-containing protein n=1 Tax=Aristolochia fimbriata TaxID=158543 RepID=A0AAV7DR40_ARIFI|nr:hypothetical protein H6P81_019189 [Aristolochia fimbriata]